MLKKTVFCAAAFSWTALIQSYLLGLSTIGRLTITRHKIHTVWGSGVCNVLQYLVDLICLTRRDPDRRHVTSSPIRGRTAPKIAASLLALCLSVQAFPAGTDRPLLGTCWTGSAPPPPQVQQGKKNPFTLEPETSPQVSEGQCVKS